MEPIHYGWFSLEKNNTTIEEVFCANVLEFSRSKVTRSIFYCFAENIANLSEKDFFLEKWNEFFSKLLNWEKLSEEHIAFLRENISTKAIDPKYYQFLSLETADKVKHPYLIRQWNEIYVNIEKIISEQNWDISKNTDNIIYYGKGRSSQGKTPFNNWDAEVVG